jgi:hypothetical protein
MGQSRKRSPSGLLSEAGKKAAKAVGQAAKELVGKKRAAGAKSPKGNLSEAAKKAGRGIADAARGVVGMQPTPIQKSGSQ